jgi:predicted protein tyrosine phosphatase
MKTPIIAAYWVNRDRFLAGEYPGDIYPEQARTKLAYLLSIGINHFIDLTEPGELNPYTPLLFEKARQVKVAMTHQRLSIPDFSVPQPAQMLTIQQAIQSAISQSHKIYVHCYGGVGRTGTVVACYLVDQGLSGAQALEELQRLRQMLPEDERLKASPETEAQRRFVLAWKKPEQP